jgi:hypothetical protein
MQPFRRRILHLAVSAAAFAAVPGIAMAQAYPTRPVRIIVGFAAGGPSDIGESPPHPGCLYLCTTNSIG